MTDSGSTPDGQSLDGLNVRMLGQELTLQGLSADDVSSFLTALHDSLEPIYYQFNNVRGENDRLRGELARTRHHGSTESGSPESGSPDDDQHQYAIDLLTQAQAFADNLLSDTQEEARGLLNAAREEARDLVWTARLHQRDMANQATADPADTVPVGEPEGMAMVRSLAKMAQDQFLIVLDAMREEVKRLTDEDDTAKVPSAIPAVQSPRQAS